MLAKAFAVDNLLMVARLVIGVAVVVASDDDDDAWLAMGLEDTDSDERHLSLFLTATALIRHFQFAHCLYSATKNEIVNKL